MDDQLDIHIYSGIPGPNPASKMPSANRVAIRPGKLNPVDCNTFRGEDTASSKQLQVPTIRVEHIPHAIADVPSHRQGRKSLETTVAGTLTGIYTI